LLISKKRENLTGEKEPHNLGSKSLFARVKVGKKLQPGEGPSPKSWAEKNHTRRKKDLKEKRPFSKIRKKGPDEKNTERGIGSS